MNKAELQALLLKYSKKKEVENDENKTQPEPRFRQQDFRVDSTLDSDKNKKLDLNF